MRWVINTGVQEHYWLSNGYSFARLQRHVLGLEAKVEGPLAARVRAILRATILAGYAGED